ncbi:MAG TPA: hypothetical protein VEL07_05850 [Planctomycetota bacterium]|nr:hypothetical protein [Planctomycetota bacterium]
MTEHPRIERLMTAVARRERLAGVASATGIAFLVLGGAALAYIVLARATGLVSDAHAWLAWLAAPLALAVGVIATRSRPRLAVARLIDARDRDEDLFATAVTLHASAGAYHDAVLARAADRAAELRASALRPWRPWRGAAVAAGLALTLTAIALWLPRFDPFGLEAQRAQAALKRERLAEAREEAKKRIEDLRAKKPDAAVSATVAAELERLVATFAAARPETPKETGARLAEAQKELARAFNEARAKDFASSASLADSQRLGSALSDQLEKDLARGDERAAVERLAKLEQLAKALADAGDPAERERLRQELKQGLRELADAAAAQPSGAKAAQALSAALEQLAQGADPALEKGAAEALRESLALAQLEMQALGQDARDGQQLREALQALQMARQLNEREGGLDGRAGEAAGAKRVEDYKKLYQRMLEQGMLSDGDSDGDGDGDGDGEGEGKGKGRKKKNTGGGGQASGGKSEFNDDAVTGSTPEKAHADIGPGRVLMQWKAAGEAEAGTAREDYQRAEREVQQQVSEALLHEQLPPGYEDAVRRYFDLDQAP